MKDDTIATIARVMADAKERGLIHHTITDGRLDGRVLHCGEQPLLNFGTCSYLGLEHHEELIEGARDALGRYGTQFSSSRAFASLPLYGELEATLEAIFERPAVVTPSTTLAHIAALPTIVSDKDAVIIDIQVHSSVQMAVQMLKADGVRVEVIRHNATAALERKLVAFKGKYERVWYLADGIYSIFGDSAPLGELGELLKRHPHLHLYIDDAHGFGWTGAGGRGWVRERMEHHERMVLVGSLNKSFAAAGGVILFPDQESAEKVRRCGGPMTFSGPIQPPMLGAALASAKLHLRGDAKPFQERLASLIRFTNRTSATLGLPHYEAAETPLFFIPLGLPSATFEMVGRLKDDGFYTHAGSFPATPMKQSGLRFMIHAMHEKEDILRLLQRVRAHYPRILAEQGSSPAIIAKSFGIEPFEIEPRAPLRLVKADRDPLIVERARSIDEFDGEAQAEWDRLFAGQGNLSVSSLRLMERCFIDAEEGPAAACDFYYCIIRDVERNPVLATVFTHSRMKDDIFSPAQVSAQVEALRAGDPLYLTSPTIALGAPITRGRHLFLDRSHRAWGEALTLLVREMEAALSRHGATQMMLRDFVGEEDAVLSRKLYELGFTPQATPEVSRLEALDWDDRAGYMRRLSGRYRSDLRREVLRGEDEFEIEFGAPRTPGEIDEVYRLYLNVFERSLEMNVFPLPRRLFAALCADAKYDVIRLYLRSKDEDDPNPAPVAVMLSFVDPLQYSALLVGLDYRYVSSHNTYKQALFQTVMRARELGAKSLDLAFTAGPVKKKVGARTSPGRVYVQVLDHYNLSVIDALTRKEA